MAQLYAVCRPAEGLQIKHVQLTQPLQRQLDAIFEEQEEHFMAGIANEVAFTGDWIPDREDVLFIQNLAEARILLDAAEQNAIALPSLDVANFREQSIKGIFATLGNDADKRILLQNFSLQQVLSNRFALLYDGDVFRRLVEPTFTLDTKLVAIINNVGDVRFKSYSLLRRILDITPVFREATDVELLTFCGHNSLAVGNAEAFVANADEAIRKHVLAISKANVLRDIPVAEIGERAAAINFPLDIADGRIQVAADRKRIKALLSFLLNKVYRGPINQQLFITNSNRPLV